MEATFGDSRTPDVMYSTLEIPTGHSNVVNKNVVWQFLNAVRETNVILSIYGTGQGIGV